MPTIKSKAIRISHMKLKTPHLDNCNYWGKSLSHVERDFRLWVNVNMSVSLNRMGNGMAWGARGHRPLQILVYDRKLGNIKYIHASLSYKISLSRGQKKKFFRFLFSLKSICNKISIHIVSRVPCLTRNFILGFSWKRLSAFKVLIFGLQKNSYLRHLLKYRFWEVLSNPNNLSRSIEFNSPVIY